MPIKFPDGVKAAVLKFLGKRKSGYTSQEVADGLKLHKDYVMTQIRTLRREGSVERIAGKPPTYKIKAA